MERRFQAVKVEEPSAEEAIAILLDLRTRLETHHGVALDESALRAAVEWSIRYLPDFRLPDKALDLVDQACAAVRFWTLTPQGEEKKRGETPNTVSLANHDGCLPDSLYRLGSAFSHRELGSGLCFDGALCASTPAASGFGFSKVRAHLREHTCPYLRGKSSGPCLIVWI
ncbi:MAG: hypothetical protein ACOYM3_34795 [Terrimicrobiaceae bacterium]